MSSSEFSFALPVYSNVGDVHIPGVVHVRAATCEEAYTYITINDSLCLLNIQQCTYVQFSGTSRCCQAILIQDFD